MAEEDNNDTEVFFYTEGAAVPDDVVRVRVHPSVTAIPAEAFNRRYKLKEVELCDGLLEIGEEAFNYCTSLLHINIPSNVNIIGSHAFYCCTKLEEMKLCEGLVEIGNSAFYGCQSLEQITIPSTLRIIGHLAFESCSNLAELELSENLQYIGQEAFAHCRSLKNDLCIPSSVTDIQKHAFYETSFRTLRLHDGIISIGVHAFGKSKFSTFRIPALISRMSDGVLTNCMSLFSLELPESIMQIGVKAFDECKSLRNLAIPYSISIEENELLSGGRNAFNNCTDLQNFFDTDQQIVNALKHRFDSLPIHKMTYYQSYNNMTIEQFNEATTMKKRVLDSNLNPTGNLQDGLGMTPLHILACSNVQNIELYKVLVEKYPENLITEDRWGALPLLYAVWGDAPSEIVQYLVESYKSIYPDYELNWNKMIATLSKAKVNNCVIWTLVDIQQEMKPNLDREEWINGLAMHEHISCDAFQFLVQCGYTERVNAIGLKKLRDVMIKEMKKPIPLNKVPWLNGVRLKFFQCEDRYNRLKEATTILELALWKYKMDKSDSKKKRKRTGGPDLDFRAQCRVSCNADMVIDHVLPYLLPLPSDSVYK